MSKSLDSIFDFGRNLFQKYLNSIENDLRNDLKSEAGTIIDRLATNELGRETLDFIMKLGHSESYVANDAAGALLKDFWGGIGSFDIPLVPNDPSSGAIPPILTLSPSFELSSFSFTDDVSLVFGQPSFGSSDLSFHDAQNLSFGLSLNAKFNLGIQLGIKTNSPGAFHLPATLNLLKWQESDGTTAVSAGLGLQVGLTVAESASNNDFLFTFEQPIVLDSKESLQVELSEDINVGPIFDAAKQFINDYIRDPFRASSEERNYIDARSSLTAKSGFYSGGSGISLGKTMLSQPDPITGLEGVITVSPTIGTKFGVILKEMGEGVDLGSLDDNLSFTNILSLGSKNEYRFFLQTDTALSALAANLGPTTWTAFHQDLSLNTWILAAVDLNTGASSTGQPHIYEPDFHPWVPPPHTTPF